MKALLLLFLSGCGSVAIHDEIFCADEGRIGAICYHTLTNDKAKLSKVQWDKVRFGWICTSPETFAELKADIEKFCSITKKCDYDTTKAVNDLIDKLNASSQSPTVNTK